MLIGENTRDSRGRQKSSEYDVNARIVMNKNALWNVNDMRNANVNSYRRYSRNVREADNSWNVQLQNDNVAMTNIASTHNNNENGQMNKRYRNATSGNGNGSGYCCKAEEEQPLEYGLQDPHPRRRRSRSPYRRLRNLLADTARRHR